jgi:hypothetical protein
MYLARVAYVLAIDLGAGQRFTRGDGAQLRRRYVFQGAAIGTNGGARSAHDNDFSFHAGLAGG